MSGSPLSVRTNGQRTHPVFRRVSGVWSRRATDSVPHPLSWNASTGRRSLPQGPLDGTTTLLLQDHLPSAYQPHLKQVRLSAAVTRYARSCITGGQSLFERSHWLTLKDACAGVNRRSFSEFNRRNGTKSGGVASVAASRHEQTSP